MFTARIYTVLEGKSLMIVNIEGPFTDAVGDSHAGSSRVCRLTLTQFK